MRNDRIPSQAMSHTTPSAPGNPRNRNERPTVRIAVALLVAAAILALPGNTAGFSVASLRFPVEVLALAALGLLLSGRSLTVLNLAVTALAAVLLFLKLADIGTDTAFQRPFNPYLDGKMIADGWNLLNGTLGAGKAMVLAGLSLLAGLAAVALLFWGIGGFRHVPPRQRRKWGATSAVLLLAGSALLVWAPQSARMLRLEGQLVPYLADRTAMVQQSVRDLAGLAGDMQNDPASDISHDRMLKGLGATDVVLIFIESYGRSAVEDPRYAPRVSRRRGDVEAQIAAAGLQARSGWLTSPTVGGLSWLAHGTLLSGLRIDSQARYDRLVTSDRKSLNALFAAAGWKTSAVMPAITMDWPEARYFGYQAVHAADGLGYRGKPFNWVTMPDQYTLATFERLERPAGHAPVMSEIALISSHAPWTPIPKLIDWEAIGDGTVFNPQAESGDTPAVVWASPERIQAQYLDSVDYVLETLGSYMARYGSNTLFVLVGDHQPAAVVTGEGASRDVPMHIVTADPALLQRLDGWNWQPGMIPRKDTPVFPMQEFREKFLRSFSAGSG
jgi:hypothetical protein